MLSSENTNIFLNKLSHVLEITNGPINAESKLEEIEWDSLSIISCISIVDELFDVTLTGTELSNAVYVKDIIDLISTKL